MADDDVSARARQLALIENVRAKALGLMHAAQQEMPQAHIRHAIRHLDRAMMSLNGVYSRDAAESVDKAMTLAKRALARVTKALAEGGPDATDIG